ncbi:DUF2934 domain-containing protein [Methylopila henanensis]|uniref:DUF2934 domain-containing protein n=1 Tax=Methylopila henanensis TaxID=873516 RepID=A0ABW4K3L6_9HYPH
MSDRDARISELAYRIWEEEGRPEGRDGDHWIEAERRYAAQETPPAPPKKKKTMSNAQRAKILKGLAAKRAAAEAAASAPVVAPKPKKAKKPKAAKE